MYRVAILVGVSSTVAGCWATASTSSGQTFAQRRATAATSADYRNALAYDDAHLRWLDFGGTDIDDPDGRAARRADFAGVVRQEREKLPAISDETAEQNLAALRALRAEARRGTAVRVADLAPIDKDELGPALDAAAEPIWQRVVAMAAKGDVASALVVGQTLVDAIPESAYAAKLEPLRARAKQEATERAAASTADTAGARLLYTRIAEVYGAVTPLDPDPRKRTPVNLTDDHGALAAEIGLAWTTTVSTNAGARACPGAGGAVKATFVPLGAHPAKLTMTIDRCELSGHTESRGERDVEYEAMIEVEVPVETYGSGCIDVKGPTESYRQGDYIVHYKPTIKSCGNPGAAAKGFHGATEKVKRRVLRTERVQVQATSIRGTASGTLTVEIDGQTVNRPYQIEISSGSDEHFTAEHAKPDGLDRDGLDVEARNALAIALVEEVRTAVRPLEEKRAAGWIAKAKTTTGPAADHAYFIASQILRTAPPEMLEWMKEQYRIPANVVTAAVRRHPLPRVALVAPRTYALPAVTQDELDQDFAIRVGEAFVSQERRGALLFTLVGGFSQARHAPTGDVSRGAIGQIATIFYVGKPFGFGGGFRMGGGYGGNGGYFDMDFVATAGVNLGGFALSPLVGLGGNFTPSFDSDNLPMKLGVPPGVYAEYGARAAYAFALLPLTVEAIYTRAVRTSDVSRLERADVRIALPIAGTPIGLAARRERVGNSDVDVGETWWFLGGLGF